MKDNATETPASPASPASPGTPESSEVPADPGGRGLPNPFVAVAGVLLVVAVAFAGWFGIALVRADNDDDLALARTRDEVTRVGEAAIVTFNTLDYRQVDRDLDRWLSSSTGPLNQEVLGRRTSSRQTIEQAKTVTTAKVLKSSVTELQEREGKAVMIAAIRTDVTPEGQPTTPKYLRVQAALERTDTGWKLSGIGYVPFTP